MFVTDSRQWRLTPFLDGSALSVWGANLGNWRCPAGAQLHGGGMAGSGGPTGGFAHARYVGVPTTTALSSQSPATANAVVRAALRVFEGLQNAVAHGRDVYFPRADSAAAAAAKPAVGFCRGLQNPGCCCCEASSWILQGPTKSRLLLLLLLL